MNSLIDTKADLANSAVKNAVFLNSDIKKDIPAVNLLDDPPPRDPISPVDQIYKEFAKVFGNSNPRQLFSLIWPGTILDYETYKIPENNNGLIPSTVNIAQSVLFDTYYPLATITQPDGTRVSDRYKMAIESYGPIPNERLLDLQRIIRDRLDQLVDVAIDGKIEKVTLLEKFNILQNNWIQKKINWGIIKSDKYAEFKKQGGSDWWEEYISWYENTADGYIEAINASYNRMIADFPLTEFEDALAILDTHDAAALLRAKQEMRNAATPIPPELGSNFYLTNAIPADWGRSLKPSSTFIDLLASPEAQQHYLDLCIEQLQQQIFAWNAVMAQIPLVSKDQIAEALAEFNNASQQYFDASNQLIKDYTDNTVLAVKTYKQYKNGKDAEKLKGANNEIEKLNVQNGGIKSDPIKDEAEFNKIADAIGAAQKKLIDDTGSMVSCGQRLGEKASAYLQSKAGEGLRELITPVLMKLNAQLDITVKQIQNFNSSAGRAITLDGNGLPPLMEGQKNPPPPEFSSVADSLVNQRWSNIVFTVKTSDMSTNSETNTSFSQTNWNVDFFFGSAGGQSKEASEKFATDFMENNSEIQIGMLATKVIIERPWMHPEIFSLTKNFFTAIDADITIPKDSAISSGALLSTSLGGNVSQADAEKNCIALNKGILPNYPVALLLVKDVTIKLKFNAAKTSALQEHSESNESNGGGFLCFSVSRTQSATSDKKSASSYSMGGDYVFRIPAPQIVGVWNQILPPDESTFLDSDKLQSILKFKVHNDVMKSISSLAPFSEEKPVQK